MEYALGPIYYRECDEPMKVGQKVQGHQHNFDHVTRVVQGSFHIEKWKPLANPDGTEKFDENGDPLLIKVAETDIKAGLRAVVLIEAYAYHSLTALEDGSIYVCEFTHRDPKSGDVVQRYDGWHEATT